jgi:hypothetical protein
MHHCILYNYPTSLVYRNSSCPFIIQDAPITMSQISLRDQVKSIICHYQTWSLWAILLGSAHSGTIHKYQCYTNNVHIDFNLLLSHTNQNITKNKIF